MAKTYIILSEISGQIYVETKTFLSIEEQKEKCEQELKDAGAEKVSFVDMEHVKGE